MALRCRKNQASLTATERSRFVAAVLALKAAGTYDQYVQRHIASMAGGGSWAHRGPAFLPWHRKFLLDFELDLRAIDPTITLPYWDWTVDAAPS
jgi:tyrosinase